MFEMSAGETPKNISMSEVFFLCKAKVSSDKKIKVAGKCSQEIHKLICIKLKSICLLNMLKVMLPPFAPPNLIIILFALLQESFGQSCRRKSNKILQMMARSV